jgi:hypothetical protein
MATYNYYREYQSPSNSPKFPTFWLYAKVDFSKQNVVANDVLRLFKVKDKWLLLRGFMRCLTASGAANTLDLGTSSGGQQLDAGFNANSAGDWIIMDTLKGSGEIALTADGYIFLENLSASATAGITEIAIEVFAGPEDQEEDSLTED